MTTYCPKINIWCDFGQIRLNSVNARVTKQHGDMQAFSKKHLLGMRRPKKVYFKRKQKSNVHDNLFLCKITCFKLKYKIYRFNLMDTINEILEFDFNIRGKIRTLFN